MSRFAVLMVALLVCALAEKGTGQGLDASTHVAAPPGPANWHQHGKESSIAGLKAYIVGSPSAKEAVVMINDVFGYKTPLFRVLADKVAAHGYYVVAPDYFMGDPYVTTNASNPLAGLSTWLVKHPPAGGVHPTYKVIAKLRMKGIHSIGIAAFCWGGKVAALAGKKKVVKAIVQLHPAFAEASDYQVMSKDANFVRPRAGIIEFLFPTPIIREMMVPIEVLASPTDGIASFKAIFHARRKMLKSYVRIFKGVMHGWTIRYDVNDPKAVRKAYQAHRLMLQWFAKYL